MNLLSKFSYLKPVTKLFFDIIEQLFKENGTNKTQKQKAIKEEMEKVNQRLTNVQNMVLDKTIAPDDYKSMKENLNTELSRLAKEHMQLSLMDSNYSKYVSFGSNILQNLSEIYAKASIVTKQRIIGLTFPEKLKFIENEYRTFGMAKVLSLICPTLKELHEQKKGTHSEICYESRWVDPLGLEPRLY